MTPKELKADLQIFLNNTGKKQYIERTKSNTVETPFVSLDIDTVEELAFKKLPYKYKKYEYNIEEQLSNIYFLLRNDVTSRRAVVSELQGYRVDDPMFPCIILHHFMIRDGELNCFSFFRSSDLEEKLINDIRYVCFLQLKLSQDLMVPCGKLKLFLSSLHYYE